MSWGTTQEGRARWEGGEKGQRHEKEGKRGKNKEGCMDTSVQREGSKRREQERCGKGGLGVNGGNGT